MRVVTFLFRRAGGRLVAAFVVGAALGFGLADGRDAIALAALSSVGIFGALDLLAFMHPPGGTTPGKRARSRRAPTPGGGTSRRD